MKTLQLETRPETQNTNEIENLFNLAKELSMTVDELSVRLRNNTPMNQPRLNYSFQH